MNGAQLAQAELAVLGQLVEASNTALLVELVGEKERVHGLYKPISGERPLWDFPDGCLAHREVAAHLISQASGFDIVPPTAMRDGPLGHGSVQLWVGEDPFDAGHEGSTRGAGSAYLTQSHPPDPADVVLTAPDAVPTGYLPVLAGRTADGARVVLAHADTPGLAAVAVFDAVLNNTDRKASHLLRDPDGRLWGIDHGVSLHTKDKLRTVLWGWAGQPIPGPLRDRLDDLAGHLDTDDQPLMMALAELLTPAERAALRRRTHRLLSTGDFPRPVDDWPSVPWPPI